MVREATPAEYPVVAALTEAAYSEYAPRLDPEAWAAYRADLTAIEERARDAVILVADRDGEIAGTVAYFPPSGRASRFPAEWASIRALAVAPAHRGHGIGRRLTEACIERARSEGAPALGLGTTGLMSVAKRMYESMGFQRTGEFDGRWVGKFWTYTLHL